jgi:hypothetical protein
MVASVCSERYAQRFLCCRQKTAFIRNQKQKRQENTNKTEQTDWSNYFFLQETVGKHTLRCERNKIQCQRLGVASGNKKRAAMAHQLTWQDLTVEQVEEYFYMKDRNSKIEFLRNICPLPPDKELAEISLDLYYYTLQFAQQKSFTADKVSVLFSIVKNTHDKSMANFWPAKRSFDYFKELLLQHSVQRPPFSIGLFPLADVRTITDFMSTGYFRHYMLYKYAYTKRTELAFSTIYTHTMSVPDNFLQPLAAGEEEDKKLAREEQEKLAKLQPGVEHFSLSVNEYVCVCVCMCVFVCVCVCVCVYWKADLCHILGKKEESDFRAVT